MLPREIRLCAGELKAPGESGSLSRCGRVHRRLTPPHLGIARPCAAPRISNANAARPICMYSHVQNVQHFHNRRWPVPSASASKYDNSVRWTREESCMWEKGQRVKTDITNSAPSIHHASVDLIPLHAIFRHYHWWYYACLWCRVTFRGQNCTFLY